MTGLPSDWEKNVSQEFTKQEVVANPDEVLQSLEYNQRSHIPLLPTNDEYMKLQENMIDLKNEHPSKYFEIK